MAAGGVAMPESAGEAAILLGGVARGGDFSEQGGAEVGAGPRVRAATVAAGSARGGRGGGEAEAASAGPGGSV